MADQIASAVIQIHLGHILALSFLYNAANGPERGLFGCLEEMHGDVRSSHPAVVVVRYRAREPSRHIEESGVNPAMDVSRNVIQIGIVLDVEH